MPYDAARARANLRAIMAREGLRPTPWAVASGLSKNAITQFLKGKTDSLTVATIWALAENAGLHPTELTDFGPPPEYESLLKNVMELVARLDPTKANADTAVLLEQTAARLEGPRAPLALAPPKRPAARR